MSYAAHSAGRLLDHLRRRAHTLHRKRWPRLQTRSGSRTTLTVLRKPLFATVCPPFACRRSDPYRAGTSAGPEETRATDHRAPKGPPRTAPPTNTRRNSRRTISLPTKEGRSMSPSTVTRIHRWMRSHSKKLEAEEVCATPTSALRRRFDPAWFGARGSPIAPSEDGETRKDPHRPYARRRSEIHEQLALPSCAAVSPPPRAPRD